MSMNYQTYFTEFLNRKHANGEYRNFLSLKKDASSFPVVKFVDEDKIERRAVNWCSNDYLGMSVHPELINVMKASLDQTGIGSGGTRNISGTTSIHGQLESVIAKMHSKESALLFNSAYLANQSTIAALGQLIPDLIIYSDEENHASIIQGVKSSNCEKRIFRHNDSDHLEELLKNDRSDRPKIIIFESVYSMSGTIAPFHDILRLAEKYRAMTYVDEVHAVGLYGPIKGGISDKLSVSHKIDIINGTLAKAIGVIGGYVTGNRELIDALRLKASGFIFTSSLPPALCQSAIYSIRYIQTSYKIHQIKNDNLKYLRALLDEHQIEFIGKESHITIIPIGNAFRCKKIAHQLLIERGVYLQPIFYPTVPKNHACLRVTVTPRHSKEEIENLVEHLKDLVLNKKKELTLAYEK